MSVFVVIFYGSYRKENDWRIHGVYQEEKEALDFARKWSYPMSDRERDDYRDVVPNTQGQKVLLDQKCGKMSEEEYYDLHPDAPDGEFVEEQQEPDPPYKGMSWTPYVAVVEVPFNK